MASQSSSQEEEEEPQPSTSREDPSGGNVKRRVLSSGSEPSGPSAAATAGGKSRSKSQGDAVNMDVSSSDDDMPAAFEPPSAAGTLAVVPVSDDKQGSAEPTPSTSSGQVYR